MVSTIEHIFCLESTESFFVASSANIWNVLAEYITALEKCTSFKKEVHESWCQHFGTYPNGKQLLKGEIEIPDVKTWIKFHKTPCWCTLTGHNIAISPGYMNDQYGH